MQKMPISVEKISVIKVGGFFVVQRLTNKQIWFFTTATSGFGCLSIACK
jgi:hypothetical protein